MITEKQMQSAVAAGILDQSTADAMIAHANKDNLSSHDVDEEHFRLVTGFNDIFVVIASMLLLISLNWIGGGLFGGLLAAMAAWGLAEFFVLKRRMALPAIVLLLAFVSYVFYTGVALLIALSSEGSALTTKLSANTYIIPAIIATIAAWLHWQRFKVPVTVAAGTSALVGALLATVLSFPQTTTFLAPIAIMAGLAVFLFAMRWDALDTKRQTRQSDVAFWLHLIAAPLIIHPIFDLLGVLHGEINLWQAGIVFSLYITIAIASLLIDRRALMVSALGYVIYVFSTLLTGAGASTGFAITAFTIGSALLILSAFWHSCRAFLLRFTPGRLKQYLPNG